MCEGCGMTSCECTRCHCRVFVPVEDFEYDKADNLICPECWEECYDNHTP